MYTHSLFRPRRRCACFLVLGSWAVLSLQSIEAAEEHPSPSYSEFAQTISTKFLLDLPHDSDYRVALVHEQVGNAVLLPIEGSDSPVIFLAANAMYQVIQQRRVLLDSDKTVQIEVKRASIPLADCPELAKSVSAFNGELRSVLTRMGKMDPGKRGETYRNIAPDGSEVIIVDGATLAIQVRG